MPKPLLAGWLLACAAAAHAQTSVTPQPLALADGQARLTYVDFWASWCGPCRQSFPWMNQMQDKYGAKGLRVLAVNLDARREDAQRFLAEHPARFALGFDP